MKQTLTHKKNLTDISTENETEFFECDYAPFMPEMVSPRKGILQSVLHYSQSLKVTESKTVGQFNKVMN